MFSVFVRRISAVGALGCALQLAAIATASSADLVSHRATYELRLSPVKRAQGIIDVRGRMGNERPAVVTIVGTGDGKPSVVVAVNGTAQEWRLNAGELVKVAAATLGGNGGGKSDVAQGGGTDPAAAGDAVRDVEQAIGRRVTSG